MRGVFRRPFTAVISGCFLAVGGLVFASVALFMMAPRHVIVGVTLVLVGISFAGIWPGDRDFNDEDTQRWRRFGPWVMGAPLIAMGIDIFVPVNDLIATICIAGAFAVYLAGNLWFIRHGVPLEDHHIEAEMAKPGHNPLLSMVMAKPNRWGRIGRRIVLGVTGVMAFLIISGSALLVWEASREEPHLASRARWNELPVQYCLDTRIEGYVRDATFAAVVERSFERWGVPAESTGECASAMRTGDGISSIGWHFRADGEDWLGSTPRIGSCEFFCDWRERRSIGEADIRIEPLPGEDYTYPECLDDLMLHEVGHFLGLDHVEEGVMAPGGVCYGEEFASADLAALFDRYGDDVDPQYGTAARE